MEEDRAEAGVHSFRQTHVVFLLQKHGRNIIYTAYILLCSDNSQTCCSDDDNRRPAPEDADIS